MNIEQAKRISLPRLLAQLGYKPERETKGGLEFWYASPFRPEKAPSFHTSFIGGKWIWNDFGDIGGTVIDFVMRHQGFTRVSDALRFLDGMNQGQTNLMQSSQQTIPRSPDLFSFQQQETDREAVENFLPDRQLEFLQALPLRSQTILTYLAQERGIPAPIAQRYLQLVRYRNLNNGRDYFAFGMPNQAGGYEIRVASNQYNFKSALLARDITVIPGTSPERKNVHVFEGMTDFLSFLVLNGVHQAPDDCIIMHSLSSFHRAVSHIRSQHYQAIKTYLDNDKAGQQGTEKFKAEFGAILLPQGEAFAPHHDLNDLLRAQRSQQKRH
ncbi:toprim domain-containing protein [Arsenicibacter rosenii]|uniref:Zinc finger CHC2-type domain-containing protein n=1 Tax=Arsenicibacter rosenii TaxID=1750698 RepID=A0A1S2VAM7_9BACT|nr:toprim domain-containing protein [Arsenicibacter rosenii]OIN55784.1 hypothetical protein BLX24_28245 [Arsenicibacter rosenii]